MSQFNIYSFLLDKLPNIRSSNQSVIKHPQKISVKSGTRRSVGTKTRKGHIKEKQKEVEIGSQVLTSELLEPLVNPPDRESSFVDSKISSTIKHMESQKRKDKDNKSTSTIKHLESEKKEILQKMEDKERQLKELDKVFEQSLLILKQEKVKRLHLEDIREHIWEALNKVKEKREHLQREKNEKFNEKMQAQRYLSNLEDDLIRLSIAHDDKRDECLKYTQEIDKLKRLLAKQKFKIHISMKRNSSGITPTE